MNTHYKDRYNRFVQVIQAKVSRTLDEYTENHHILPRCMHGTDSPDNIIKLTLREHFLAHWLLWKAYPKYLPLASAFLQMNHKNPKSHKPFQGRITSRTYAILKTQAYDLISANNTDKVSVRDHSGKLLRISRAEYKNSDYVFHTTGKIYAFDKITDTWVYILSSEFRQNKSRYLSRLSTAVINRTGGTGNPDWLDPSWKGPGPHVEYPYVDIETNEVLKLSRLAAREKNMAAGHKQFVNLQKKHVNCIDSDGHKIYIPLSEYDPLVHTAYNKDTLVVYDTVKGAHVKIGLQEYNVDPTRYNTTTKDRVLAKDSNGNNIMVSAEQFKSGNYVGQTKGLRMVKDLSTGKFVQISAVEYETNKGKYAGPNVGKSNVIHKVTGIRSQIQSSDFDNRTHASLGNKKFLFMCRNMLTNATKNVNIYEWHLFKDHYEIIQVEKFNRANTEK